MYLAKNFENWVQNITNVISTANEAMYEETAFGDIVLEAYNKNNKYIDELDSWERSNIYSAFNSADWKSDPEAQIYEDVKAQLTSYIKNCALQFEPLKNAGLINIRIKWLVEGENVDPLDDDVISFTSYSDMEHSIK